jgi:hypothetical protein
MSEPSEVVQGPRWLDDPLETRDFRAFVQYLGLEVVPAAAQELQSKFKLTEVFTYERLGRITPELLPRPEFKTTGATVVWSNGITEVASH